MALFARRHYAALANWAKNELKKEESAKALGGYKPTSSTIWGLAIMLGYDNSKFDLDEFITACGLEPLKEINYEELICNVKKKAEE